MVVNGRASWGLGLPARRRGGVCDLMGFGWWICRLAFPGVEFDFWSLVRAMLEGGDRLWTCGPHLLSFGGTEVAGSAGERPVQP